MPPTFSNGKICYLFIPSTNIAASASFYESAFGWKIRRREDGSVSFDDGVGEVSGTWLLNRKPDTNPGILVHIMVDDALATCERIVELGGAIIQPIGVDAPEITAHFSDPAGNVMGIYQNPV